MARRWFRSLEEGFPWGAVGVALSLLFGAAGLYLGIFYAKRPQLRFETLSSSAVYDVRENVPSLEIKFEGTDIRAQHRMLSVMIVRISNPSRVDILQAFYDPKEPLTITLPDARIIECKTQSATTEYLARNAQLAVTSEQSLSVPAVIFEAGQSFVVRLLVLHPESSYPSLVPSGKIAGIQKFEVIEAPKPSPNQSLFHAIFQGDALVQILRTITYGLAAIVALICVLLLVSEGPEKWREMRRRSFVKRFITTLDRDPSSKEQAIFDEYVRTGEIFLARLDALLRNSDVLGRACRSALRRQQREQHIQRVDRSGSHVEYILGRPRPSIPRFLVRNEIVEVVDSAIQVDSQGVETLRALLMFLMAHVPNRIKSAKRFARLEQSKEGRFAEISLEAPTKAPLAAPAPPDDAG